MEKGAQKPSLTYTDTGHERMGMALCTMYVSATYICILELIAAQRELSALMSEAS
jgi:hypothetical protein